MECSFRDKTFKFCKYMKIKFFKKENNFKKEKESLWWNINLYWKLTVSIMFAIFFLAFFFGYYLFMRINKEHSIISVSGTSNQAGTVKKERIDKALQYFSLREQKSKQILNSPAPVIDPSL
jgi:hypothetical protein